MVDKARDDEKRAVPDHWSVRLCFWYTFLFHSDQIFEYAVHAAQEDFFFERVAMALPQDSPWMTHFNREIQTVFQVGLIGKWKQVMDIKI